MIVRKSLVSALLLFLSINALLAQQQLDETILYDGNTREYTVYIPEMYDGSTEVPLLFNFHGGSGDIASQIYTSDMRPIADSDGFILVYPQALEDPNDDGSTNWTHKEPTDHNDIFFVEAMIDALSAEYTIDENRVYGCGYSNGGEFAFELACGLSNRIAAIGVVARSMYIETYNDCSPERPMPVVTIHGSQDDYDGIVWAGTTYYVGLEDANDFWTNFNNTDSEATVVDLPDLAGNDGSTVEHYSWSNGDSCVSVEHFKVIGGGHDWPGTFGNMDIDSNMEIWDFVSRYNLNGLIACAIADTTDIDPTDTTDIDPTDTTNIDTAIDDVILKYDNIQVYPNPSRDFVRIEMDLVEMQEYHLYSTLGELVLSGTIGPNNKIVDLSRLDANMYFLKVGDSTVKLVKTN